MSDLYPLRDTYATAPSARRAHHIKYTDARGEAVWWFSKRDFLPRGVQRVMNTPSGQRAIQQWQITNLAPDPRLAEDAFKLVIPEGYEKIEGNAP